MGNIGALVSQKNYDVKNSADRFKVFSSSFQTLKIFNVYSVTGVVPEVDADDNTITINHNLGYYAPFIVIHNGTGSNNAAYFNANIFPDNTTGNVTARQYINKLEIDISEFLGTAGQTVYYTVYVFLDDFRTVTESTINSSTATTSEGNDYGFRVSKDGFDVKTDSDENMVISSSFFNQIVHKKGIATANVSHNLGYIPNFLAYTKDDANSYITNAGIFDLAGEIDSTTLYADGSDSLYYIIFKNQVE